MKRIWQKLKAELKAMIKLNKNNALDLTSIEFAQQPFHYYDELRKTGNVHYLPATKSWLIIGYHQIVDILNNYQLYSSAGDNPFDPILLNCDPPTHTKNKKILSGDDGIFATKKISKLEQTNRQIFQDIINPIKNKSQLDIMVDIALPFSTLVILNLLGIKPHSIQELKEWSTNAVLSKSIYNTSFADEQWQKVKPIIQKWIDEARTEGSTFGIASLLLNKEVDFANNNRLLNLTKVLLLGGNETTPNLVTSALLLLYQNKQLYSLIKSQPDLIEDLINETLRLEAPTQLIQRTNKAEVIVDGITIPAYSNISLAIGAANRDPHVFENPNQFDLKRVRGKILSFGYGPHYCIGATLAKQEAQIAIEEILHTFPNAQLRAHFKPVYKHSSHVRGLLTLPVNTDGQLFENIQTLQKKATRLLEENIASHNHFSTVEHYPKIDTHAWHYTYPSPFIHANVLYSLISCNNPNYANIIADGLPFLAQTKETNNTWRFWNINNCRNPVPPDVDDTAICTWVLASQHMIETDANIILHNIDTDGAIYTWFRPTVKLLLKSPTLFLKLWFERNKISNTIKTGMLHGNDVELGVMANALLLLGQTPQTEKTIALCINKWNNKNDQNYFYDNWLVIAYHLARAYHNGIKSFEVLKNDMLHFVENELIKANTKDYLLIYLIAKYFNLFEIKRDVKIMMIASIKQNQINFAPYKYFTSKDRNFYGGSACLTAAWFLEVTNDW